METATTGRRGSAVIVSAALATTVAFTAADPIERVVELLPGKAKVLLVSQGLYHEHPQCPTPIEGDSKALGAILVGLLTGRKQHSPRARDVEFVVRPAVAHVLARDGRDVIASDARERSCTHVLYFQATKRYRWDLSRQEYMLRTVDWTFRLHDLVKDQTMIVQGPMDIDIDSTEGGETIPVSCHK